MLSVSPGSRSNRRSANNSRTAAYGSFFAIVLLVAVFMLSSSAKAEPRTRKVGVFHVVARTGVDPGVVDVFAVVLQSEIRERGYEVIGRGDVEALLGLERTREALGCELTSCLTELAGSMGVDEMITLL